MKADEREIEALDAIIQRAQAGDDDAFGEIYRAYRPRVFGLCRYLLGSVEAAEDAASEVFIRARRAMSSYDSSLPFPRWLLSIASHHCIDVLRRRRIEQRLFETDESDGSEWSGAPASALNELLAAEQGEAVRAAIGGLPDRLRVPLVLRFYNEMSYDQIATSLRLKRNHVATLLFRAKKELRRTLARSAAVS